MPPVVVSLCDRTGNMGRPWAEAGWEVWCIDIQHSIRREREEACGRGKLRFVWGDVRTWSPPAELNGRISMVFAFPPCTHVAVSGARDFLTKGTAMLRDSLEMFAACEHAARWAGVPYMIENPVGKFSDHMGKPNHTFQPWQYGDLWTKKTCLWIGNGFVMPEPVHTVQPEGVRAAVWLMAPSEDRADKRSETPMGFARAVFQANAARAMREAA
jgi:hypothetical protein